jgi:3-carboxy-cis,cis-muconate cycloisomerase
MPTESFAHPTDSRYYRDMFGTAAMRDVWGDAGQVAAWLQAEEALARAEAEVGLIPAEAAQAIAAACRLDIVDWDALKRGADLVGYAILPLVRQIAAAAGPEAGGFVHWGATTQDIMDTGTVLQVRAGRRLVEADLGWIIDRLASLAREHRDTVMAGRTHGQQALPITFGYKLAVYVAELRRGAERLARAGAMAEMVQFAGAAGTLASVGPAGLDVQRAMGRILDLGVPPISWHTSRDGLADVVANLGLVTSTLAKLAQEVAFLQRTEVGEVEEGFVPGRGGSSTMPQKRNPIASEAVMGAAKVVRQLVPAMLDAMLHDNERATGPWHTEWLALPEAFVLTSGILAKTREILDGLVVRPDRMRRNLELTGGMINTEALMMALAPTLGRQVAHDVVYDATMRAIERGTPLIDELVAEAPIAEHSSRAEIERLLDPANYIGLSAEFVDRVLGA